MRIFVVVGAGLLLLLFGFALITGGYVRLDSELPSVPVVPGTHLVSPAKIEAPDGAAPSAVMVMWVEGTPIDALGKFWAILEANNWGEQRICRSGVPGITSWRHAGAWFLDAGWVATVEYANEGGVTMKVWRGDELPAWACGDLGGM